MVTATERRRVVFAQLGRNVPVISGIVDDTLVCIVDESARTDPDTRADARMHLAIRGLKCAECQRCIIGQLC